ncbi:hypothetical protein EMN47_07585 [Prolixibacteraceae bacterium JC049]|nr:hypothetical protein [Prolixibacteraceae bacterium JC049]
MGILFVKDTMKLKLLLTLILSAVVMLGFSQVNSSSRFEFFNNWRLGVNAGVSSLITEYDKNSFKQIQEFNYDPSASFSFTASKLIMYGFEVGYEFEYTNLKGAVPNSDFTATKLDHHAFKTIDKTRGVSFKNGFTSHNAILLYHFGNISLNARSKSWMNFFVKFKAGYGTINSEVFYTDDKTNIFTKKGGGDASDPLHTEGLEVMTVGAGIGARYYINDRIQLNIHGDISSVNNDCLDGVHNMRKEGAEAVSNFTHGLYGRVQVGIVYNINFTPKSGNSGKYNGKKNYSYLPWYRRIFKRSKLESAPSQKVIDTNYPWYRSRN